jgi:hypothetical protein
MGAWEIRHLTLMLRRWQRQERPGVPGLQAAFDQALQDFLRQTKKPNRIGHRGTVLAHLFGHLVVRKIPPLN